MVYADYAEHDGDALREHPVNDHQPGSLRDGFDFGPLILISTEAARAALRKYGEIPPCRWAGWYDLRLKLSTDRAPLHLPERLCIVEGTAGPGAGQFAYVDPRNRLFQEEMEAAATAHLKRVGAWLAPVFRDVPLSDHPFPVEASVVIPVRNRVRTVADAVESALAQRADFPFNVIVVDNHSTDGTTGSPRGSRPAPFPTSAHRARAPRPLDRRLLERGALFRSLRPVCRSARFG